MTKSMLALLAASGMALPIAMSGGSAFASDRAPTVSPADPQTVRVGTLNTEHANARMTGFADVIGWQEVDSYGKVNGVNKLNKSMAKIGYAVVPQTGAASADAISYNAAKFTLADSGKVKTVKGKSDVTPARFITWARLIDKRTGKQFVFANTHFISGAFTNHPERMKKWQKHAAVLQQWVAGVQQAVPGLPVYVVGDFNAKPTLDLQNLRQLADKGKPAMRGYDRVYVSGSVRCGPSHVLAKYGSDHNARRAYPAW
jgi:hypothetical protein